MRYRFTKASRLKRRQDIAKVFDSGFRAYDRRLTVLALRNELGRTRGGFGVSKRHGNAVHRNRVKRVCREAFRLTLPELPAGYDLMIIPSPGISLTVGGLQNSIRKLVTRIENQETD